MRAVNAGHVVDVNDLLGPSLNDAAFLCLQTLEKDISHRKASIVCLVLSAHRLKILAASIVAWGSPNHLSHIKKKAKTPVQTLLGSPPFTNQVSLSYRKSPPTLNSLFPQ
jgi:hypothetical protein